jgi:hypothetical protein
VTKNGATPNDEGAGDGSAGSSKTAKPAEWDRSKVRPGPVGISRRQTIGYAALRVGLFAVAFAVCLVAGLSDLPALLIALVVSGLASYPLARRQRDAINKAYQARSRGDG